MGWGQRLLGVRGATRTRLCPGSVSSGASGSGKALSNRLAGPRSISQLLGNLLPASFPRSHGNRPRSAPQLSLVDAAAEGRSQQGAEQSRAAAGWGRVLEGHVLIPVFSSHPNPPGVRVFQELFFATVEPATPKMEAPCAAIKREPSELFLLRLHSHSQDGRLGSGTPPATPNMAPWSRRSGLSILREMTHTARFRFFFCRKNSWLLG